MGKATRKLRPKLRPRCIVIAGPNGAGKTTFARDYQPGIAKVMRFVNADLIAVEARDDWLEGAFKCRECGSHLACRDTESCADVDLDFLESWFAAESADVARVRHGKAAKGAGVP
jgi:predicted ABC-type ATPase